MPGLLLGGVVGPLLRASSVPGAQQEGHRSPLHVACIVIQACLCSDCRSNLGTCLIDPREKPKGGKTLVEEHCLHFLLDSDLRQEVFKV